MVPPSSASRRAGLRLEDGLQRHRGEQARPDGRADADVDVALALRRAGLDRKVISAPIDEDRLEPFAQQDDERLEEEVERRQPVADDALGVLEVGHRADACSAASSAGVAPPAARVRREANAASS